MIELRRNRLQNYLSGAARILDLGATINRKSTNKAAYFEFERGTEEINKAWSVVGETMSKSIIDFSEAHQEALLDDRKD